MSPLVERAHRIAADARAKAAGARRGIERLLAPSRIGRRLFFDADAAMTPDAAAWFQMVGDRAFAEASTYDDDPRRHAKNEGRRELYLEMVGMLEIDERRLAAAVANAREILEDDD